MSGVKDLIVRLLVDDSDLDKVDRSASRFDSFKSGLNTASVGATAALGGIITAGAVAMNDLARVETINAQTASVIESTGGAANVTGDHVAGLAGKLEGLTATEGEAIQEGANLLLTFKNIQNGVGEGNDIFDQSTAALVDMARAMGTDPQSSAIQLGKALNDPIAGISALSRVGVQFTEDQKSLIESLVESGDTMGAQKIILGELNSQFGGSGASYAETMAGKQDLLAHKFGETAEQITSALLPSITQFLDGALEFATWASENSELLGVLVGVVGAVAVGVLTLNGVVTAFQAVQAIQTAAQWASNAAWLASPVTWIILAIVVAIGLLIAAGIWLVQNWDGVAKWFGEAWTNIANGFQDGTAKAGAMISQWWTDLGAQSEEGAAWIGDRVDDIVGFFTSIPERVGEAWSGLVDLISGVVRNVANFTIDAWNNTLGQIDMQLPWFLGGGRITFPQLANIPALATGGIVTAPTLALIGEAGPEAVVPLSQGSRYGLGGGGGDVVVPVVIDGREIWRIVKRWDAREG